MGYQRDIHEDSWKSRKSEQDTVVKKSRIQSTLTQLDCIIEDGNNVFDLGCGDGTIGTLLKQTHAITIDGCDISEVALERAQNDYRNVYELNIDDEEIPVNSSSYDVVICTDVLEHTLSPIRGLNEIKRLLKDDGVAVISVPNYGFVRYRINSLVGKIPSIIKDERHYNTFTISRLRYLLEESGLDVQKISGVSRLQRLAKAVPQLFAKTIIVTVKSNPKVKEKGDSSREK
jgi:methionine biosynthesis protein MetW